MAIDYGQIALDALEAIQDAGRSLTVLLKAAPSSPSAMPWRDAPTVTEVPVTGVLFDAVAEDDGSDVLVGDEMIVVADTGTDLSSADAVRDGSLDRNVVRTEVIKPGSRTVAYLFLVRRRSA